MTIHSSPPRLPILSSPATEGSLVQRLIGSRGRRALKPRGHQILVRGPCGSGAGLPDPTGGRATAFWRPDKAAPPAGSRLRVRGGRNLVSVFRSGFLRRSDVQLWADSAALSRFPVKRWRLRYQNRRFRAARDRGLGGGGGLSFFFTAGLGAKVTTS